MRERAVTFGSHGGLVGIVSEPDLAPEANTPAVLLFNVGLNHHVGPHRLNVELARQLAERGFASLRFDLSGLGDSEPRADGSSDDERAVLDVREAMDMLGERKGVQHFVVVGLCSGVDPAHVVAVTDPRVKGAVFIDGYAYTTPEYQLRDAVDRALRVLVVDNYRSWFRRRVLPLFGRRNPLDSGGYGIFDRAFPPRAQYIADLKTILARGVKILFIYTRQAYYFNHRSQFEAMIGVRSLPNGIEVEYQREADHVFTSVVERAQGVQRVSDWMDAHFGSARNTPLAMSSTTAHPPRVTRWQ